MAPSSSHIQTILTRHSKGDEGGVSMHYQTNWTYGDWTWQSFIWTFQNEFRMKNKGGAVIETKTAPKPETNITGG